MNRKLLILIVGLLLACFAQAQVAGITATPATGCLSVGGLNVLFNDATTGGTATSWSWNFGDIINNTSTSSTPNHTYNVAGTYTVTLTINGGGSPNFTATQKIIVNAPPTVRFSVDDSTGCFPLNVNFNSNLTTPGTSPNIVGYRWDFGDGDTSIQKDPSHTYIGAANYPITLEVIDQNGCQGTSTKSGYIVVPNGVTASFTTTAAAGCKIPITIQLNNTSGSVPGFTNTYTWNFGDNSPTSNITSPPHTYTASGTYNIKLVAQSPKGCIDSITVPTQILAGNVSSSFQAPDSVCVNTPINFLNTSAPQPSVSNWDFGNGTNSSLISVNNKIYTAAGVYTVKLVNTFGACIDSVSSQITVLTPAVPAFTASPTTGCDSLFTVNFTDQSVGASSWVWSFGDGTTSNQQNPTHTYKGYGTYTVTLQVSNAAGCTGSLAKSQYIQNRKPILEFSKIGSDGCAPFSFSPILIDTVIDGISTYAWDFGDGSTSTSATPPAHLYPNAGTYYVKLTITTNGGCSASAIDTVMVGIIKPVASFTASPTTTCVNSPVAFSDHSTNNPNSWLWSFGDGGSSIAQDPSYAYTAPGTYIVTLRAYNNGCNDSAKATVIVNLPLAKFAYTFSCASNTTVFDFHDSSQGADTWAWNFGDGSPISNVPSPTHTYAVADSTYTATLTVTNNTTHCTNSISKPIYIIKDTADYIATNYNVCRNQPIQITVFNVNYKDIALYSIDFGDGYVQKWGNPFSTHAYTTTGTFTVRVILTLVSGCLDTLALNVHPPPIIHVSGPTANFTTSGSGVGCTGLAATFVDQSTGDGVEAIKQWIWDFGDSTPVQTYSGPPFTHNYTRQGIYSVKLKVIDASGCADSISKINLITVAFPTASFTTIDSLSCPGSPINFVNNSKGYGLKYYWNFGDGSPIDSTDVNPAHTYLIGTYKVSLNVIDQFTCTASTSNYNILIDTPSASFTINDTFASCPPLTANFTFTGSYYKSLRWVFGDGGISSNVNPTHFYNLPGNYTAGLVVTSHGGCTATAPNVNIRILGPTGSLSFSPDMGCHILNVNFNFSSGDNVTNYLWLFSPTQADSTKVPSISFTYDSMGIYHPVVVIRDSTGCSVPIYATDSVVIVGSKPNFGFDKSVVCGNGTVQFSDSTISTGTIGSYQWDFGDGSPVSNAKNPSHFYATPGSYSVKLLVTTTTNCQDSVTLSDVIKVVANPVIGITGDDEKCVPASMNFQGVILQPDTSAYKWQWNFGNGQTDSAQNPAAQIYTVPGVDTVKLTATNSSNCSTTASKVVKIDSIAVTNAGPDTAICVGQSAFLHASSLTPLVTYTWLPPTNASLSCTNCFNPIATPATTTTYYAKAANALGCGTIDSVVVIVVQPATLNVSPLDDSVCLGQSVQLNATGESVYTWSPSTGLNNPSIGTPIATPDTTTTYQVTGSDSLFCFKNTQSVIVNVFNYPTISLGPNTVTIPIGTTYQINGIGSADIDSINWSPTIGLSCANCLSPIASPVTTTTYVVKIENNGGCITTDSIRIIVTCDGKNLFVPNTFSPNGDGMNDWFYVQGKGLSTIQSMRVFNRWGQLVFEKKDFAPNVETEGWDGNFNGRKAPVDVYIYTIEVICENSQVVAYHGNVALIR